MRKINIAQVIDGKVSRINHEEVLMTDDGELLIVDDSVSKHDLYDGVKFSENPDIEKIEALEQAKQDAVNSLKDAKSKSETSQALADAKAAVDNLP